MRPSPPKPGTLPFPLSSIAGAADGDTRGARPGWIDGLAIVLFTAVGLALRLPLLTRGIWRDEGSTYADVLAPSLGAMLAHLPVTELTPPLYFIVMFYWTRAAGTSEVALHVPSLIFGLATIGVMYVLGKLIAGRVGAIVCAGAATLSPLAIALDVEARSYALVMFLAGLLLIAFSRALLERDRRPKPAACIAVFVCGFLLVATHFTGLVIVAALAMCAVVNAGVRRNAASYALAASSLAASAAGLPLLLPLRAAEDKLPRLPDVRELHWFDRISDHLNAFSPFGSMHYQLNVLLAVGVAVWLGTLAFRRRDERDALTAVMLTVVVLGIGASIARGLPIERHLTPYAPAVWALMGLLVSMFVTWLRPIPSLRWLGALPLAYAIVAGLVAYPRVYARGSGPISGGRAAFAAFSSCCDRGPTLVVAAPDFLGPTIYYYARGRPGIVLRGVGTWDAPQFYNLDPRRWNQPNFVRDEARQIRDLSQALHARVVIFGTTDRAGYYPTSVDRSNDVTALLARQKGVLFERHFPGSRESIVLTVLR